MLVSVAAIELIILEATVFLVCLKFECSYATRTAPRYGWMHREQQIECDSPHTGSLLM
jgi:hypothetical protein